MNAAWLGVVGAAVGALCTLPAQALLAKRAERASLGRALRSERVAAYSTFADRIMDWRRSQIVRAKLVGEGAHAQVLEAAVVRDENRRVRAAAWTAYYQLRLLSDDAKIDALAFEAIEATRVMKRASDPKALDAAGSVVRERLDAFLEAASRHTRAAIRG